MQPGIFISLIGHFAVFLLIVLPWGISAEVAPRDGVEIVPVEIVDVALEANVRALSTSEPEEAVASAPSAPEASTQPTSAPEPQRPPRPRNDDFNLDDISGMIDRERDPRERANDGQTADRNQRGAGLGTEERATIESRAAALVNARLRTCWRTTADLPDPERLRVVVSFRLNRNGSLNGQPNVVSPRNYTFDPIMNEAVQRALRAVRACDLSSVADDPVVGQHYEVWRDQEVTFGVRG
jgi:hypothetical protein